MGHDRLNKKTFVLATSKNWNPQMRENLENRSKHRFIQISSEQEMTSKFLDNIQPDSIFIPHWSFLIPESVFNKYPCIIFHMTDLPFGRGGSPLQNLISQGIHETKISAIHCVKELDGGPVYLKQPLSLYGNAEEIYIRAGKIIEKMIVDIIQTRTNPVPQTGEPQFFPRRTPQESNMSSLSNMDMVFDHIRMLDAEGYPPAYIEAHGFRFEFSRASLKKNKVKADVSITKI